LQAEPAARARRVILWDVDTQVDFMLPDGKLYVPGAEATAPAMKRLVDAARAANVVHVASADDHELTDDEVSDEPDLQRPNPRFSAARPQRALRRGRVSRPGRGPRCGLYRCLARGGGRIHQGRRGDFGLLVDARHSLKMMRWDAGSGLAPRLRFHARFRGQL